MFLGFGGRRGGVARRIAIRIGGRVGRRRISLHFSTVIAGFRFGSCAGVRGRLLGFLREHCSRRQKRNKNKFFHIRSSIFRARVNRGPGSST